MLVLLMSNRIFSSSSLSIGQKQNNLTKSNFNGVALSTNSLYDAIKTISDNVKLQNFPTSGGSLTVNSLGLNNYDYVVKESTALSSFIAEEWFTNTQDSAAAFVVVKGDLTINSGVTFTPHVRKLFTCILVEGNLTVNGTITMTARGASTASLPNTNNTIRIINGAYSSITNPEVPSGGGSGASAFTGSSGPGNSGSSGQAGGSGGGGSGGKYSGTAGTSGAGASGSAFSGGSGGGGVNSGFVSAASSNGGAGGNSQSIGGGNASGGGAGNPPGKSSREGGYANFPNLDGNFGTGGTLIIFVTGTVSGTGTISSNGSKGGGGYGLAIGGGGGSGGGSVNVICLSGSVSNLTATGGARGEGYTTDTGSVFYSEGGAGGNGTARILTGFTG